MCWEGQQPRPQRRQQRRQRPQAQRRSQQLQVRVRFLNTVSVAVVVIPAQQSAPVAQLVHSQTTGTRNAFEAGNVFLWAEKWLRVTGFQDFCK